jgi:16S rRNA A1518/A1519 N6-dimethyltransferase RsmA/KsgA/DIM1 with predicted DNA glycosylase/AP lyase activity
MVYDIGAGSGIISSVLTEHCRDVVAIEFEPRTAEKLRANMAKYPNVSVVEGDFLQLDLPTHPYKIFANIPFHLSSPIVRKITESANPPQAIYLIVQKQFADKLVPDSRRFTGQIGSMIGPTFAARVRHKLQRTDYLPRPNVDTVLLELLPRRVPLLSTAEMPRYRSFVEDCFSDPKKFARAAKSKINLADTVKPSEMSLPQWVLLYQATFGLGAFAER